MSVVGRMRLKKIKKLCRYNINAKHQIKRLKWKWAGHMARYKGERWAKIMTFWYMGNYKRRRGRQKTRWADDINKMLKHKLFHRIAEDRLEWLRLQEAYAQL